MVGTEDTPFVTLLAEYDELQAQVWAIVGDTNPPLISLLALKPHRHEGSTPQIQADGLSSGAVITDKIQDLAVIAGKIAVNAVNTAEIMSGAIHADEIQDGAVIVGKIAANAVLAGNISSGAVITDKIQDLAVIDGKLAANAVISGKIADGAVNATAKLANNIVDDTKVGDRVPALTRRQGGHATDWMLPGTTTYTPGAVRMQCGSVNVGSAATITFPIAFSAPPIVIIVPLTIQESNDHLQNVTATQFQTIYGHSTTHALHWIAIGPE
jgi:hypothetical protein